MQTQLLRLQFVSHKTVSRGMFSRVKQIAYANKLLWDYAMRAYFICYLPGFRKKSGCFGITVALCAESDTKYHLMAQKMHPFVS
jgi:hypothetical protein